MENKTKKIELNFQELLNYKFALDQLKAKEEIDIAYSMRIIKLYKKIQSEIEIFEEAKEKLISSYCAKDESGKNLIEDREYVFDDDLKKQEYIEKYKQALDEKVEIEYIPLKLSELKNMKRIIYINNEPHIQPLVINPYTIELLEKIIEE